MLFASRSKRRQLFSNVILQRSLQLKIRSTPVFLGPTTHFQLNAHSLSETLEDVHLIDQFGVGGLAEVVDDGPVEAGVEAALLDAEQLRLLGEATEEVDHLGGGFAETLLPQQVHCAGAEVHQVGQHVLLTAPRGEGQGGGLGVENVGLADVLHHTVRDVRRELTLLRYRPVYEHKVVSSQR